MLLIRCPYCEEDLPELEFRHAGEAHIARPGNLSSIADEDFEKFFFIRSNPKGIVFGCARFFNAVRDTVTDRFVATYKAGEPRPELPAAGEHGTLAHQNGAQKKQSARKAATKENEQ
jgi:sarcosine oxidase subunit delta